ncbi:hypothetical protein M9H77_20322 [Catharanthus roseus]|uniref:Uncharacterized protein n=1 Tax=Catharanthus roseus TaxID=4058 RepID=A0ACC0AJK5_CATRO|nr:hypothetical protein M9H77_20322 [Catharanthus roseus]
MAVDMDYTTGETMISSSADDECSDTGDFECNICFELAQDPIVTLCGHLYCWPCLYQWLQVQSYCSECPVCKAVVQEEKLVPIYGRGKASTGRRSQYVPEISVPNRPVGQRPQTAPPIDINYFRQDELDPIASARFGHLTLSAIFSILPTFFSFQMHGFHDATVYGATTGVPHLFTGSFHGGYAHGFHHQSLSVHIDGKQFFAAIFLLFLGVSIAVFLMFW